jgi:hypothetical protein
MTSDSTTPCLPPSGVEAAEHVFDNWFVRSKLVCAIGFVNSCKLATSHRNGHPTRSLMGSFHPRRPDDRVEVQTASLSAGGCGEGGRGRASRMREKVRITTEMLRKSRCGR